MMASVLTIRDQMTLINRRARQSFWLISCLLTLQLPGLKAQADEQGWVLTQRSSTLGDQYVYISPSGVKIQNAQQGVGTIVRAPSWDVLFFNDKTRVYFPMSYQAWKGKLASKGGKFPHAGWAQGRTGSIMGLRATQYNMKNTGTPRSANEWVSAEYWVANDIKVNPKLSELLSTAYGTPDNPCVPLRLTYKTASGKSGTSLDTYREQATSIPTSYFNGPTGYQLAKSEVEVMMTHEQGQIMNDIAKDLGNTDASRAANHIPTQGIKLPNGKTYSREQVSRYVDAFKAHQAGQNGN
jgi:hypothetical protein